MWIEERKTKDGKTRYKFSERYECAVTGKIKKVSVTLNSDNRNATKQAALLLQEKINKANKTYIDKSQEFLSVMREMLDLRVHTIKPGTAQNDEMIYNKMKTYIPEGTKLQKIKLPRILKILHDFYYEQNYSWIYANKMATLIRKTFEHAKNMGYIADASFVRDIKITRKPLNATDVKTQKNKFLDRDELADVLDQLTQISPLVAEAMEFMSRTGLRFGELAALRSCDFDGDGIDVNGTIQWSLRKKDDDFRSSPKNVYSNRYVVLDDRCKQIVRRRIIENEKNKLWRPKWKELPYDFIFRGELGGVFRSEWVNKILKKVKSDKNITTHIFRHTHIAILAELGMPLKTIMERVGHNNPKTTLAIYGHVTKKMNEHLIRKMNAIEL